MEEFDKRYYNWLLDILYENDRPDLVGRHKRLLKTLWDTEYVWRHPMDRNRASQGKNLRVKYERKTGNSIQFAADAPCSLLEMLIAFCIDLEDGYMSEYDVDDRTATWFWGMMESMHLLGCDDAHFDEDYAEERIWIFLDGRYAKNGDGGLFTILNCPDALDVRKYELWRQKDFFIQYVYSNN